jgi:hypothetical protein
MGLVFCPLQYRKVHYKSPGWIFCTNQPFFNILTSYSQTQSEHSQSVTYFSPTHGVRLGYTSLAEEEIYSLQLC